MIMSNKKYVWTVATGCVNPLKEASRQAVDFIKKLDGFVAVHPEYPCGILWLFDSENNAKGARNLMEAQGIQCGRNICRGWINGNTLEMEGVDNE
jgi:hypothetical protein